MDNYTMHMKIKMECERDQGKKNVNFIIKLLDKKHDPLHN